MRSAWIVLGVALGPDGRSGPGQIQLGAAAGAAPRAGRVVRVERRATGLTGTPRYCTMHPGDMFGSCVGTKAPEVGDRMTVIDHSRLLGVVRVTQVNPYTDCQQINSWTIQTVVDRGDLNGARGTLLAISDVPLDARYAKLVTADQTPTGHLWGTDSIYAIDNNADGKPDVEFITYLCDDLGNVTQTGATSQCHEVWAARTGRGLERVRHDRFRICY